MNDEHTTGPPDRFVRLFREQARLIAVVVLVFGALGYAVSRAQQTEYTAGSSLLVQDPAAVTGIVSTALTPQQLALAEAPRITRLAVARRVKQALGSPLSTSQLSGAVSTSVDATSNLLLIDAKAPTGQLAANLANQFARQDVIETTREVRESYASQAQQLRASLGQGGAGRALRANSASQYARFRALASVARPIQLRVLATVPSSPSSPKTIRNTIIALFIGLLVGIGLADVRRSRDCRLRDASEVEGQLELPVIGHVGETVLGYAGTGSADGQDRLSPADLESFRILRRNLETLGPGDMRSIAVTSALEHEGKSTVATLLAQASAAAGKRTLLVECDLRRPVLGVRLGLAPTPGLTDYLADAAAPRDVLQPVAVNPFARAEAGAASNSSGSDADGRSDMSANGQEESRGLQLASGLACITAGSSPRPAELFTTERFRAFLKEVAEVYDAVILDTSPLLPVVDTLELIPLVDGALMCVRASQTTRDQALAAKTALARAANHPVGVVVTGVTPREDSAYTYYESAVA